MCPSNWPTDYSLLRAWYLQGSLYQFALSQYKKIGHRHMFAECTLDLETLASRVFFPRPANYLSQVAINQQWANFDFPNHALKRKVKKPEEAAFEATKQNHRNTAARREAISPAIFVLDTTYHAMLAEDKRYFCPEQT